MLQLKPSIEYRATTNMHVIQSECYFLQVSKMWKKYDESQENDEYKLRIELEH